MTTVATAPATATVADRGRPAEAIEGTMTTLTPPAATTVTGSARIAILDATAVVAIGNGIVIGVVLVAMLDATTSSDSTEETVTLTTTDAAVVEGIIGAMTGHLEGGKRVDGLLRRHLRSESLPQT